MTTADTLALAAFVAFIAALFIPSIVQRRRARRRLRASLLAHLRAELNRQTGEALRWAGLYRDKCSEYTALVAVADAETVRAAGRAMAENPLFYVAAAWTAADDDAVRRAGGAL